MVGSVAGATSATNATTLALVTLLGSSVDGGWGRWPRIGVEVAAATRCTIASATTLLGRTADAAVGWWRQARAEGVEAEATRSMIPTATGNHWS